MTVNGNGHYQEAGEPQQTLFSWAEFMAEEPVKAERPARASPSPQASRCSSGRWSRSGRPSRSARDARPQEVREEAVAYEAAASPHVQRSESHSEGDQELWHAMFVYDDREFPDPDPEMTVDQVKGTLSRFLRRDRQRLGEGDQARGEDTIYEFQRRVGTKGALRHLPGARGGRRMDTPDHCTGLLAATPPVNLQHHRAHGGAHTARRLPRPGRRGRTTAGGRDRPASRRRTTQLVHRTPPGGAAMQAQAASPPRY